MQFTKFGHTGLTLMISIGTRIPPPSRLLACSIPEVALLLLLPVRASPEDPSADAGSTELPADPSRSHCHTRPRAIGGIENLTASCGF
jgi:hypothetical protein